MKSFEELLKDKKVIDEYKKSFLLNLFQKLCSKMNKDILYKKHIKQLFLESFKKTDTIKIIFHNDLNYDLDNQSATTIVEWVNAYFNKSSKRIQISEKLRKQIITNQHNLCAICGEPLSSDPSQIHIDHIIPWKLVGDELKNNYQAVCATCNECKSAKTDFVFKKMIKLI